MPPVCSIASSSIATAPFSEADLAVLLASSRMHDEPLGLPGRQLHRDGRFQQALEGPERAVRTMFRTAPHRTAPHRTAPRPDAVCTLHEESVSERRFGSWATGCRVDVRRGRRRGARPVRLAGGARAARPEPSRAEELLAWFRDR